MQFRGTEELTRKAVIMMIDYVYIHKNKTVDVHFRYQDEINDLMTITIQKEWIRAEIDNLENTISEKKEKILHFEEQRKRMQWFLDHSKGDITRQMADEIIDSVIVAKDGVTVMFREGL